MGCLLLENSDQFFGKYVMAVANCAPAWNFADATSPSPGITVMVSRERLLSISIFRRIDTVAAEIYYSLTTMMRDMVDRCVKALHKFIRRFQICDTFF